MLALVLAGGYPSGETGILRSMTSVRKALALDLLECLSLVEGVTPVLLSDDPWLLQEAVSLGCQTQVTGKPFAWLSEVQRAVREYAEPDDAVLVMGGAAAPMLTEGHVREVVGLAEQGVVWQNNRLSPDLVLYQPASQVFAVTECGTDNEFGYALERQAGMKVAYMRRELAFSFDVDTPLDAILAATHSEAGVRLRESVRLLEHRVPLPEALAVLRRPDYPDVAVIGRAHPVEAEHFAQGTGVRLRLYSEERGMKALGRIEQGVVRSLIAPLLERLGAQAFFDLLAEQADCAIWDTRVLFAHHHLLVREEDRFYADLGLYERVRDPWLAEFTEMAGRARIPVLTGGQSLVAAGLRLLGAAAKTQETPEN